MIKVVFLVLIVMLFVPTVANGDEYAEKWKQYVESYKQYMEIYKTWAHNTINFYKTELTESSKTITSLENENHKLKQENSKYRADLDEMHTFAISLKQSLMESGSNLDILKQYTDELEEKNTITIYDNNIHWNFKDSLNNQYYWQIPIETFEHRIKYNTDYDVRALSNTNTDEDYTVPKLTPFVQKRFGNVIDQVWDNSDTDLKFVENVWVIVNHLTVYSSDIGEYPRYAEETLGRGGGDCEDLAILIADLILSSKHTQNWKLEFYLIDSDNPEKPQSVNHVILFIDDGVNRYFVEPTATDEFTLFHWNDYKISGWNEPIT